ncbi:MAG: hypothetical protein DCF16_18910 [Alphaproteobacteria bacterium]|nr:MAG: hypothetical protein DCF16_18910 [Alphaproteobacteria bacterium]
MRDKWVDTREYFGPDRRKRAGKKPWRDRRGYDETAPMPSLGHLLRRVRVQAMDLRTPEDRRHMTQILTAAITEAERTNCFRCADSLKQAERTLRNPGAINGAALDGYLNEAMNHAAANA